MKINMTNNMITFGEVPVNHIFSIGSCIYMKMQDFWCYKDCAEDSEMCFNAVRINLCDFSPITYFCDNDKVTYFPNAILTL